MTWHLDLELLAGIALLVAGIVLGVRVMRTSHALPPVTAAARARHRVSAHELGLAHRFAARVIGSRWRPRDEEFVAVAELWPTWPVAGPFGSHLVAMWSPELRRYVTPASAFLELEDLLEHVESFSARIRRWRPGWRRERS